MAAPARIARAGRLGAVALVLGLALAAAGCGGDDQRDVESWANAVCGDLSEWITDVNDAVRSLTEDGLAFDEGDIRDAVDQANEATDELSDDLRRLGPPETESGQEVEETLEALRSELEEQADRVERAVTGSSAPLELAGVVAAAVAIAVDELKEAIATLRGLDPSGELEAAFDNAGDCDSLREQIDEIGS
jgi:methyl-accepting chemotaxis protein